MTEFAKAFLKAQQEMGTSPKFDKKAKAGAFQYEYVSLGAVLQHVVPACNRNGLYVSQEDVCINDRQFVKTTVEHLSGEKREFFNPFCGLYTKPQEYGSAFTYTRRYALYGIFGLYGETDTDAGEIESDDSSPQVLISKISALKVDPVRKAHALEYYNKRRIEELDINQLKEMHAFLCQPYKVKGASA